MMRRTAGLLIGMALTTAVIGGCRSDEPATGLARGGQAYLGQCAVCHGTEGAGDGPLAASITAELKRPPAVFDAAGVASLGRDGVLRAMAAESHRREGSTMPLWGPPLGTEWMDPVADFVVRMPAMGEPGHAAVSSYLAAPEGTPSQGRRAYVLYCSGCHGPQGRGDGFFSTRIGLKPSPILSDSLRAAPDDELSRLISAGGVHAREAPTMPGWLYTISPEDRAALVAYLRTLWSPAKHD